MFMFLIQMNSLSPVFPVASLPRVCVFLCYFLRRACVLVIKDWAYRMDTWKAIN